MGLEEIRKRIDQMDNRIVELLNDRMELALMTTRFKSSVEDQHREREVFDHVKGRATRLVEEPFIERVYSEITKGSKEIQQRHHRLIAFQGAHGAYGEMAAMEWDANLIPIPCNDFPSLFEGVRSGLYDCAIVPVENTLGGMVGPVNELLIHSDLHVIGAVELFVHHCLLVLPLANHREIRTVYSHPQALAQCRRFLARHGLEGVPFSDTAGAAKMLAREGSKTSAAIASKAAARLYDLEIMKENVEDSGRNVTRFLVLSAEENREEGHKCSVIFTTEHKAGTLFRVLEVFARASINLTRIESIPWEPGSYMFLLDFMGSNRDPAVRQALEKAQELTTGFRLLGCYNERKVL